MFIWIDANDSRVYNNVITHSQGTNIVDLLGIVKEKKLPHFLRIYIDEFWVCYKMVSEPQVQTLWPNGPVYTQVRCVLSELLFMKMVCIRVYRITCKLKKVKF